MKNLRYILVLTCFMGGGSPVFAQDGTELLLRLDKLEADNRRLTGQVEQEQFQIKKLEEQLKRFQSDIDFRFKDIESPKGNTKPALVTPPAGVQKKTELGESPRNLGAGTLGAGTTPLTEKPVTKVDDDIMSPISGKITITPTSSSAKDMFDAGRGALDRAEFAQAETAFKEFLKSHPKDKLAPEAMYGLGESYFARQKHTEAAEQYLNITTKYGKSTRAPEAMLKLGMSLRALGSVPEACATLGEVLRRYPNASGGVKAAVTREQSRAKCAA